MRFLSILLSSIKEKIENEKTDLPESGEMASPRLKFFMILKLWMIDSNTHGLSNIARNEKIMLRALITLCFLGCAGLFIQQTVNVIQDYIKYEVHSTIKIVQEAFSVVPAVIYLI